MISMVPKHFCTNEAREHWIHTLHVELLGVYHGYG